VARPKNEFRERLEAGFLKARREMERGVLLDFAEKYPRVRPFVDQELGNDSALLDTCVRAMQSLERLANTVSALDLRTHGEVLTNDVRTALTDAVNTLTLWEKLPGE